MLPGMSPTALLIVDTTGATPKATSAGKVISVPEPTTALMAPAATPARTIRAICHGSRLRLCHSSMLSARRGRGSADRRG
jgi:hypothetical protein